MVVLLLAFVFIIGLVAIGLLIVGLTTGFGKTEISNETIRDYVFFNAFMNQVHNQFYPKDNNNNSFDIKP